MLGYGAGTWDIDPVHSHIVFDSRHLVVSKVRGLSRRFATLPWRADLPYVRFHDLRHGAASLAKAAGASSKEISQQLGHSRQSFTDTTYVTVFPDVARAAAEAAAALVPRKRLAQDS